MLHKARNTEPLTGQSTLPPSSGIPERGSRLPYLSSLPSRTSPLKFFASASTVKSDVPTNPQRAWKAEFLNDLRSNKPARPNGSRPQPIRGTAASPTSERDPQSQTLSAMSGSIRKTDPPLRTSSAMSGSLKNPHLGNFRLQDRCTSAMSHRQAQSGMPIPDTVINGKGRPLAQKPLPGATSKETLPAKKTSMIVPSATYRERGERWMEKQEARSIREALEDIDFKDEESLHAAAQDEASELVWKHQNPDLPHKNPYAPYNYNFHLQKGGFTRSQSDGPRADSISTNEAKGLGRQHPSVRVTLEGRSSSRASSGPSEHGRVGLDAIKASMKGHALWDSPQKKAYMNIKSPSPPVKTSGRRSSGEFRSRKVSGGLFRNPGDQIYEEPEEVATDTMPSTDKINSPPLQIKTRNQISKLPPASPSPLRSAIVSSVISDSKLSQFEIHKNPPSQSRNPSYLKNTLPPTPPDSNSDNEARAENHDQKKGIEIRSDDIRAATSMRLKDRSPKLPSPTVVSDRPGRPIVSFEQNWKPREINLEQEKSLQKPRASLGESGRKSTTQISKPHLPASTTSTRPIPTINLAEPPSIQINDKAISSRAETTASKPAVPSTTHISVEGTFQRTRPLPKPTNSRPFKPLNRPLPTHSATAPASTSTKSHWSPFPSFQRATAQCAACALPIAGRIVSASSQRFHPHCFTCHHCATPLEHVAFYPEPSTSRDARLARINARSNGADVPDEEGKKAEDDGDAGLRFFCHLDFHEHFSPRCRSCKTPIEGEVVVACGGEWHVGHFFCAQCGDPFDAKKPFVEREGYAWCVECHTRRFSGKCKGCRRPIVDLVVRALGAEWHEDCFCCKVTPSIYQFSECLSTGQVTF